MLQGYFYIYHFTRLKATYWFLLFVQPTMLLDKLLILKCDTQTDNYTLAIIIQDLTKLGVDRVKPWNGWMDGLFPTCNPAFRIIVSSPVPVPFLWSLDVGFGTLALDLGSTIFMLVCHLSTCHIL